MNDLEFTGSIATGTVDIDNVEMVCIPSKPHYNEVDLCIKDGLNFVVATIDCKWLSFEMKKKLGYEIERRWNAARNPLEESQALRTTTAAQNSEA